MILLSLFIYNNIIKLSAVSKNGVTSFPFYSKVKQYIFYKKMKVLKKYLKKRKSAITLLLEKQQGAFTPETFHTLRIEIKKLNALSDLVHFCFKKFKQKKTFKPFKLVFYQAGKVRELQVEEALLNKYFNSDFNSQYRNNLDKTIREELNIFFLITNPSFIEKLQKKYLKINSVLAKTSKKMEKQYMDKKRIKVEKLLHKTALKKKQMHALRKRLKEYQFNQKSLNYTKKNKTITKKNALSELLGEWHDYKTVIQHLKKAIDCGEINPQESNQLENVIATFTFRSQLLFNKINATSSNTLFKNTRNN
jgi:CHAD domain-containing protein